MWCRRLACTTTAPMTSFRREHPDSLVCITRECPLGGCLRPKHPLVSTVGSRNINEDGPSGRRGPYPNVPPPTLPACHFDRATCHGVAKGDLCGRSHRRRPKPEASGEISCRESLRDVGVPISGVRVNPTVKASYPRGATLCIVCPRRSPLDLYGRESNNAKDGTSAARASYP